ncbi:MAG TPA: hypothetical protein GX714_14955 [Chloroflexi bacterium]|jgi:photosystem II stability/assembly factor-like uncharacterized protein|nr:hypothetical protein [Chloroflexota bacterium]
MSTSDALVIPKTGTWQRLGSVSNGGTVFGLAISPVSEVPRCWAATGCGVFYSDDWGETWVQNLSGLTTPLLSTIGVAPNGALYAGALEGDLFASFDFGRTWEGGLVPGEYKATVTMVLPSPNFKRDGAAFAATDGGGLLVSRNSGKSWEDSSFGLGEPNVLALAAPSDWSQRETMFAATTEGVFVSVNGGRAWRETELMLDDDVVDVLAVSPQFSQDRTVFAGTENGSLYRSEDGGRTWDLLTTAIGEGPVNCLWLAPDLSVMVAGVGPRVHISEDRGETWQVAAELPSSLLALAGNGEILLAGLHDAGVWKSRDGGRTWKPASQGLAARGFAALRAVDGALYVMGPQEGLWTSRDAGKTWQAVPNLLPYYPLTAFTVGPKGDLFLAGQESGIVRSSDGGAHWRLVADVQGIQSLVLTPDESGWAGTSDGRLLATHDGGETWLESDSPCLGQEILSIVASPTYAQDHTLLMGTSIPPEGGKGARIAVWRSTNSGATWRQITTQTTAARWIDIAMPLGVTEDPAEQAVLATGPFCLRPLRRAKDVWISTRVDPNGANTLGVVAIGEVDGGGQLYAATGSGIFRSLDGGRTWQPFRDGMDTTSFIGVTATASDAGYTLYALSLGGVLWACDLH